MTTVMILLPALLLLTVVTALTIAHDQPRRAPRSHDVDTRFLPPGSRL